MTIKLVEDFAVGQARRDVLDSLQTAGEQCVVLALRHEVSDRRDERCPECHDDIYGGGERECSQCYGTGFAEPIKHAARVWATFGDQLKTQNMHKQGMWEPGATDVHIEAFPRLRKGDFVVRVRRWAPDGRVAEVDGFYQVDQVSQISLRTGARHGQDAWDVVGQVTRCNRVPENLPIARRFSLVGRRFPRPSRDPVPPYATPPIGG